MYIGATLPLQRLMDDQIALVQPGWHFSANRTPHDNVYESVVKNALNALLDLGIITEDEHLNRKGGKIGDHGPQLWSREVGNVCPFGRIFTLLHRCRASLPDA